MKKKAKPSGTEAKTPERDARKPRAPYEPPRIEVRRSLAKATLFSFEGPGAAG